MGLLVTLYLISSNVYSTIELPQQRGFSYIEVWMVGAQGVILIGILEYGVILAWKKYFSNKTIVEKITKPKSKKTAWLIISILDEMSMDEKVKVFDILTFIFTLMFFICFNLCYWIILYTK